VIIIGTNRVLRGGSWINNGRNTRSANRNANTPDNRDNNIGFRFAPAQSLADAALDQMIILSLVRHIARWQKANALRCVSRLCVERLPEWRPVFFQAYPNNGSGIRLAKLIQPT